MSTRGLANLQVLFAQEADQRLGRLGQLVLDLEQAPIDASADVIAEIFREVHTLKGSAAVVGFDDVSHHAHAVEERLGELRSGAVTLTPSIVDALLAAVDGLTVLIRSHLAGDAVDAGANDERLARLDAAFHAVDGVEVVKVVDAVEAVEAAEPAAARPEPTIAPARAPTSAAATAPPTGAPRLSSAPARDASGTVMVPIERLDELVRMVGEAAAAHLRVGRVVTEMVGVEAASLSEFGELSRVLNGLQERAMRTRMVPVSTITDQLQRAVRDGARSLGKSVRWEVRGDDTELDRGVLHQLSDALLHLVRNAVDHGVDSPAARSAAGKPEQGLVRLHAMQLGSEVIIAVSDDGAGIDLPRVREQATAIGIDATDLSDDEALQLIFRSGFSTAKFVSDISGRGVGLDAVRSSVEAARGRVEVRSTPGGGSEFRIVVPITLAVLRCLLVESSGQRFALPLHRVALAQSEESTEMLHAEGRRMVLVDGHPVPVSELADVLEMPATRSSSGTMVIVNGTVGRHAFLVDDLVGQRDVVVKGLSPLVPRLDVVAGASVEPDGSILLVLDPPGLIERSRRDVARSVTALIAAPAVVRRHGRLLVVDDALTVRELQRTILERAGFEVRVAADGVEALDMLAVEPCDLVLTDVEMPRMDGFTLTERIRAHPTFGHVGILILTSLASDADRRRGMDAGADGYIVKSAFDEQSLLAAVDRLVGTPV
jgi:two-component system chemotaxis sensor kinase CheA